MAWQWLLRRRNGRHNDRTSRWRVRLPAASDTGCWLPADASWNQHDTSVVLHLTNAENQRAGGIRPAFFCSVSGPSSVKIISVGIMDLDKLRSGRYRATGEAIVYTSVRLSESEQTVRVIRKIGLLFAIGILIAAAASA